jgi:cytochrome c oxidase subunit 2
MLPLSFLCFIQLAQSQSMMNPAGPAARDISTLSWIVFSIFMAVALVMWVLIGWVALRRRGSLAEHFPINVEGGLSWILVGGVVIPFVVLTLVFVLGLKTMSGFPMHDGPINPEIRLIGHQWWWEVQYVGGDPDVRFTTANEIHIPTGKMVDIELLSDDVIHSFWVPRLHGKEDLIPGQPNRIRIRADEPGVYRGQCAEFCGAQHAHMAILVVAQAPEDFNAWAAQQRAPAAEPTNSEAQRGEQVFLSGPCAFCHTIRGTEAAGGVAPDLTHIAGREGLGANTLVNNTANLEAWLTHAQSLKPGVKMPDLTEFTGEDLRSLVAYLQQLR